MVDDTILKDCNQLFNSCKSLILATTGGDNTHASYAPFIVSEQKFYILVSGLAEHTNNLIEADAKIGCMLLEDEVESKQIFARKRLMFKSRPEKIERQSERWNMIMNKFESRFGDIISLLGSLPDFVIFELSPTDAVLVKGFGDAHQLDDGFADYVHDAVI